ncbi:predicted protein [Scheffersomyces stipitis CBS 6054]|uniref:Uncharacterized protein n=1 Tax=Scheffersomyces stipitis (strain ATCC 58785 / CBS 6054 / NBRC 10063 / NRRL Y-11545) TaxID=322104 RepID=A3LVW4_PICST|nr:predicted protein [Scheffersomyces stipitis CBS 6054]ABN66855.2 predicted protein [Scheffersomyces stipitis CBS 6054]
MFRRQGRSFVLVLALLAILVTLHLFFWDDKLDIRSKVFKQKNSGQVPTNKAEVPPKPGSKSHPKDPKVPKSSKSSDDHKTVQRGDVISKYVGKSKLIVFPKAFEESDSKKLYKLYTSQFKESPPRRSKIIRFSDPSQKTDPLSNSIKNLKYHKHPVQSFNAFTDIEGNMEKCGLLEDKYEIEVSKSLMKSKSLKKIVQKWVNENSTYFQEINEFFHTPLQQQLKEGSVDSHWFRLAGSSVWLEQYGIHFMVSRIIYAENKDRGTPNLSMIYAQAYDENWKEVENLELVVPTNNPNLYLESNDPPQFRLQLPQILPIPIHLDKERQWPGFYGAEDPRIIAVKNARGFEEPLVFYNSYHGKVVNIEEIDEGKSTAHLLFSRNMFMAWPFQTQRGKYNVQDLPSKYHNNIFTRVLEIKEANKEREGKQKNWTPFISSQDRKSFGYDKYIYMSIRIEHLQILRCPVVGGSDQFVTECEEVYLLNPEKSNNDGIGPLRGGSQFVNINNMLESYSELPEARKLIDSIPKGRELWFSFARANLEYCGCGVKMYRPNLVVVVKDGDQYKISYVSSFVDLAVEQLGWILKESDNYCPENDGSVMIPNGIASWTLRENGEKTNIDDYMTLSYSLADATVEIIHIRGVLKALLGLDSKNQNYKLFEKSSALDAKTVGYNNDNIDCALENSKQYCQAFGEKEKKKMESRVKPQDKEENKQRQDGKESETQEPKE